MSEQRSRLFSPTTGIGEAQYYSGTGAGGTMHYQQSELINKNPDILLVAKGNFWGTPDGPQEGDIVGNVDGDSWREEHFLEAELLAEDDTGNPDAAKDITDKYGTDIQLLT